MTVRTWFTISALVVVGMAAAVALQFTRPVGPPEIILRSGDARLPGVRTASAWPQRDGHLARSNARGAPAAAVQIPSSGTLRFVFAYPGSPKKGEITITNARHGTVVRTAAWRRLVRYDLPPGDYLIRAVAGDRAGPFVAYEFAVTVTRSGS